MEICLERKEDYLTVENLIREVFWNVYAPGCSEHYVMHCLRKDPSFEPRLDYVVWVDGKIVGQIAYAKGKVTTSTGKEEEMLLFGPVGIHPDYQKHGYGSALIKATLEKAQSLGYPAVVITGNPDYYQRFGFELAYKKGIYYQDNPHFPYLLVKIFDESRCPKGAYEEPGVYFVDEKDVDCFDQQFIKKEKLVLPGQL